MDSLIEKGNGTGEFWSLENRVFRIGTLQAQECFHASSQKTRFSSGSSHGWL